MAGPENAKRMIKKTFNISGMHCVACALNIDGELEDTPGITASNTTMKSQAHIIIEGDVTGVGYRAWTKRNAIHLELAGWVKNRSEGVVEALFIGEKMRIEEMIELCNKGPDVSLVKHVEVEWVDASDDQFDDFQIRK